MQILAGDQRVVAAGDEQKSRLSRREHAVSRVGGSVRPGPAASLRRWRCGVERLAGKPVLLVLYVQHTNLGKGQLTRPSAQSIMTSKGRSARYMAVVHHHIGRPKKSTMAQNETIT